MSIICTVYTQDCIVTASDSRLLAAVPVAAPKAAPGEQVMQTFVQSDSSQMAFLLSKVQAGITVFTPFTTPASPTIERSIMTFERDMVERGDSITDIATKLRSSIQDRVVCHVAGYDKGEQFVYMVSKKEITRVNKPADEFKYGIHFSGDRGQINKLLGTEPKLALRFGSFTVNEAAELAEFFLNFTIGAQRFEAMPATVGGAIDVLVMTPEGAFWKAHKYKNSSFIPIPFEQHSVEYIAD